MGTKVVAVLNQKGGVGKSTVSFHLAHAAAKYGKKGKPARTLVIDMDSQANLSQYLTGDFDIKQQTKTGVGLLLEGKPFDVVEIEGSGIHLLHGHKKLDRYDDDAEVEERCIHLRRVLDDLDYDFIIIDTPPALGLRHLMPMVWADVVVIPMEPIVSSIGGFQDVLETITENIEPINPSLKWVGVINRMNKSVGSHRVKEKFLRDHYGDNKIVATLTARTAVSDAMEDDPSIPVWQRPRTPKDLKDQWLTVCRSILAIR